MLNGSESSKKTLEQRVLALEKHRQLQEKKINILEEENSKFKKQISFLRQAPNRDCFDMNEVAEMIDCTNQTVKNYVQQGKLIKRFPKASKGFHRDDVDYFLKDINPPSRRKEAKNALLR